MSGNNFDVRQMPEAWVNADEGMYFVARNPTPGSGIAQAVTTSLSDTAALATLFNNNTAASRINIYPDYLRLICTAAGASSVSGQFAIKLDTGNRFSSAGSTLTPVNVNRASGNTSNLVVNFGAVVATAATAARIVTGMVIKTQAAPCWVVGDSVLIRFGNSSPSGCGLLSGAAASVFGFDAPPMIIEGQQTAVIHLWNPSNAVTPPSWEVEIGYWER